jgi:hypothetical protein
MRLWLMLELTLLTGNGIHRSARVWADIDLLLTSSTITEAHQRTRVRHLGWAREEE